MGKNSKAPMLSKSVGGKIGSVTSPLSAKAIGNFMSTPAKCAVVEPSLNSARAWMIDFFSMTASILLVLKSHLASRSSKSLLVIVAESMVILFPIDQLGCLRASLKVASFIFSSSQSLKAPPLAVM